MNGTLLLGVVALVLVNVVSKGFAQGAQSILIFGGRDHSEFLGCLNCNEFAADSVWNDFSTYGWGNSFGKWNEFGPYKGAFSAYSACNEFASDPPVLVDKRGGYYGRLSVNSITGDSVCGQSGSRQICRALKVMCAST